MAILSPVSSTTDSNAIGECQSAPTTVYCNHPTIDGNHPTASTSTSTPGRSPLTRRRRKRRRDRSDEDNTLTLPYHLLIMGRVITYYDQS